MHVSAPSPPPRTSPAGDDDLRAFLASRFASSIDAARTALRLRADDPVTGIHEFRKSLRRARSLVKLVRPCMGPVLYRRLADRLRTLFLLSSGFRDADVLLEIGAGLPPELRATPEVLSLRDALAREDRSVLPSADPLRGADSELARLRGRLGSSLRRPVGRDEVANGIERLLRRARRTLRHARSAGDDDAFHEWRKRVKELRYAVDAVESLPGGALRDRRAQLAALAQTLGNVTDLVMLGRAAPLLPAPGSRFRELLRQRIDSAREAAFAAGAELLEAPAETWTAPVRGHAPPLQAGIRGAAGFPRGPR